MKNCDTFKTKQKLSLGSIFLFYQLLNVNEMQQETPGMCRKDNFGVSLLRIATLYCVSSLALRLSIVFILQITLSTVSFLNKVFDG